MGWGFILKLAGMASGINIKKVLQYWREIIIVLLLSVVWYQNSFETRLFFGAETIPALEKELVVAKNDLKKCADANGTLSDAIEANNVRIREYEVLTGKMQTSIDVLKGELDIARAKTNADVDIILNDPTPQTCEKAIDYLRNAGDELKW
jgi:hypothetical protein